MATFCAYWFFDFRNKGMPTWLAFAAVLVLGVGLGVVIDFVIMRPLRDAPVLAKIVGTLGVVVLLEAALLLLFGSSPKIPTAVLPNRVLQFTGARVSLDRLLIGVVAVVVTLVLAGWSRWSKSGLVLRAASDDPRALSLLGYSPEAIGTLTWAIGGFLAAVAGVLLAPIVGLSITGLTLTIVPVFAAAVVGRFTSFGITTLAAFGIGMVQSIITSFGARSGRGITWLWQGSGRSDALPVFVIVVALFVLGKKLPLRGDRDKRMPSSPAPTNVFKPATVLAIVGVVAMIGLSTSWAAAFTTTVIGALVALSLVVVTGYAGQISLAQMTFVGVGAFTTSRLAQSLHLPFPLPVIGAGLMAAAVGVVIGIPALRIRGMSLAVVTLAVALAFQKLVFESTTVTGGFQGSRIPAPHLFGAKLGVGAYGVFCIACLYGLVFLVARVRRGSTGRHAVAVKTNERAAAASGVNVVASRLKSFAFSAFLAGVAGSLLGYQIGVVAFERFSPEASMFALVIAYMGGITMLSGALLAGLFTTAGVFPLVLQHLGLHAEWGNLIAGGLLVLTIVMNPNGVAGFVRDGRAHKHNQRRSKDHGRPAEPVAPAQPAVGARA
jgi:ABC-type branched-subunit amino acid transport system permease subunit